MKWYIGHYSFKLYNKVVKEYYISNTDGDIVAGDFRSYQQAKSHITKVLLKQSKT